MLRAYARLLWTRRTLGALVSASLAGGACGSARNGEQAHAMGGAGGSVTAGNNAAGSAVGGGSVGGASQAGASQGGAAIVAVGDGELDTTCMMRTDNQIAGSRIVLRNAVTAEGDKAFIGFYDNEKKTECQVTQDADGKVRCMPRFAVPPRGTNAQN